MVMHKIGLKGDENMAISIFYSISGGHTVGLKLPFSHRLSPRSNKNILRTIFVMEIEGDIFLLIGA